MLHESYSTLGDEDAERHLAFLLEASAALVSTLSREALLEELGRLAVPFLADWCAVELRDEEGRVVRTETRHADPSKQVVLDELRSHTGPSGFIACEEALERGEPVVASVVTDEHIERAAEGPAHFRLLRALDLDSYLAVPLRARGRTLGAIVLARSSRPERPYAPGDVALAEELGRRAAMALDNARLFEQVQDAGHQLRVLVQTLDAIVWEADRETLAFTFVSQRAEELLGYPVGRWTDEAGFFESILHPHDRDRVVESFREAVREGATRRIDHYRAFATDGRVVWLREILDTSPRHDDAGRIRGLLIDTTEEAHRELRMGARHAATRVLADATTVREAAPRVLEGICRALAWDVGELWVVDDPAERLELLELWHTDDVDVDDFERTSRTARFLRGDGLPGTVWKDARPVWVRDLASAQFPIGRAEAAGRVGLRSGVGIPVRAGGRVIAVMTFFDREALEPDDQLMEALAVTGFELGGFIERRRAEEALRFRTALLTWQSEATLDGVLVVDGDGRVVFANRRFAELWGLPSHEIVGMEAKEVRETVLPKVVDPGAFSEAVEELDSRPDAERRDTVTLTDGRILDRWTAPLRGPDGVHHGRAWYYRDVTAERRTEELLRRDEERAAFLSQATSRLNATLRLDRTLGTLAELAVPRLGDLALVHVKQADGSITCEATAGHRPTDAELAGELADAVLADQDGGGIGAVLRDGETLFRVDPADADPPPLGYSSVSAERLRIAGVRSAMFVPLVARDERLGVLTVVRCGPSGAHDRDDRGLAEDLAQRAAFAIQNARSHDERTHIARTLQQSLLPPQLPSIPGTDLAARYHPAGDGTDVGGDFYDVFATGRQSWGITLGDVSGKGAEAAALTALARHTLRAAVMEERKPSRILSMLNEAILRQRNVERFCSVLYGHVETRLGGAKVVLACGGHPLPYVLRAKGRVEQVGRPGSILGILDEPELHDVTVHLRAGDTLVFYTDGVTEARGPTTQFGEGMLTALLGWCKGDGPGKIAERIERTVIDFQKGAPSDDIAILALQIRPGWGS